MDDDGKTGTIGLSLSARSLFPLREMCLFHVSGSAATLDQNVTLSSTRVGTQ